MDVPSNPVTDDPLAFPSDEEWRLTLPAYHPPGAGLLYVWTASEHEPAANDPQPTSPA